MTPLRSARICCASALLLGTCLSLTGCKATRRFFALFHHRKAASAPNSPDFAEQIQKTAQTPTLAMLRWPDFRQEQPAVTQFYDDRDNELAWTRDGKPTAAASAMLMQFADAEQKGLNPEDYDAPRWSGRVAKLTEIARRKDDSDAAQEAVAQFDVALTINAMRYLSDLHVGRVNPQALNFDIDAPGKRSAFDLPGLLNDKLVDADDMATAISAVEPQNPMYKTLEEALPKYMELAKQQAATPPQELPSIGKESKGIAVGGTYGGLEPLAARLRLEGDLSGDASGQQPLTVFTQDLSDAVKHFQQRHGLTDDGKLQQSTIDALNVPMSDRVHSITDALERWRWLPDTYVQPRVLVNLPEFMLRAYEKDHSLAFKMRVVAGETKGGHDTPMFVRQMRYVVFRPFWNLPPSIVKKEIVPHLERSGMGYLSAHNYELYKGDGSVVESASIADIEHGRFSIRQKPGPSNSLGLVKFLFPNEYDVYMHSTPELPLFNLMRRDRSHGCVRLQHADQMAVWVMQNNFNADWDADKVKDAMTGDDNNKTYSLKTTLPVVITYMTATADEDGSLHFFRDYYSYDKDLEHALAKGRPYAQGPAKINPHLVPGETE